MLDCHHLGDSGRYLFRMVYQQLSVIHFGEYLDTSIWVQFKQMLCLGFGNKSLLCAVPIVDIGAVDGFQLVGVNILISISHSLSLARRPRLFAFIQEHIEIVRAEHQLPESRPVSTSPDVHTLVVPQRIHAPSGQRQQWRCIHYGVVNCHLVPLQYPGKYFPAKRESIGNIQMPIQMLLNVSYNLHSLIVDGGKL